MVFQGSMVMTRESPKDYVVLSTNQSKELMSGGQMSCNKDAVNFWSSKNVVSEDNSEPKIQHEPALPNNAVTEDMDEWVKNFVKKEFFVDGKNERTDVESTCTDKLKETEKDDQNISVNESKCDDTLNDKKGDILEETYITEEEDKDNSDYLSRSIVDDARPDKVKRKIKVFKFVKNAIKRHIKK